MSHIEIQREPHLATLTLKRPERRNALHGPMWSELGEAARALAREPPRAVLVAGHGEHFSAGMDLKLDNPLLGRLVPAAQAQDAAALRALVLELKASVDALQEIGCPVIAVVEGACTGGGLEIALACDLRVAARDAFFSLPEARVGMMPDVGGTIRLMRLVGRGRAAELILSNERIDAATAHGWGLVNRLAEPGQAMETARALARQLTSSSPAAAREVLRVLRAPSPSFEDETEAGVRVLLAGEAMEGAMSFMERRAPRWAMG